MHELAIVEALLTSILNLTSRYEAKFFKKIIISVGEIQRLDRELLKIMLVDLLSQANISFGEIVVEEEPAVFQCSRCGFKWDFKAMELPDYIRESIHFLPEAVYSFVKCPSCGSRDYDVVSGRVLRVSVEF